MFRPQKKPAVVRRGLGNEFVGAAKHHKRKRSDISKLPCSATRYLHIWACKLDRKEIIESKSCLFPFVSFANQHDSRYLKDERSGKRFAPISNSLELQKQDLPSDSKPFADIRNQDTLPPRIVETKCKSPGPWSQL